MGLQIVNIILSQPLNMKNLVCINGSFVPEARANISVFDRGFLYGDGIFETLRAYKGKIFRLDAHLKRLFRGSRVIKLSIAEKEREMEDLIYALLDKNNLREAYVRLTVTRRAESFGLDPGQKSLSNLVIIARDFTPKPHSWYKQGIKAVIVKTKQNEFSPLAGIKSLNFLNRIMARLEIKERGIEEGILLNTSGRIAEAAASNIFLVLKGQLLTPSLENGILPGITRQAVLELAPELGLKIAETNVLPSDLKKADEAFLTNSLIELVSLIEVDGKPVGCGSPGPATKCFTAPIVTS